MNRIWRDLLRSWRQHTGVQIATLTVLTATFTVVATVLTASLNLQRILDKWGNSVNMTAYLDEGLNGEDLEKLRKDVGDIGVFSQIEYVSKKSAKESFQKDLANVLPSLMKDESFGNPFPASLELGLKKSVLKKADMNALQEVAAQIGSMVGVEDVTYGQDWVENYTAMLSGINRLGVALVFILLLGGTLVIGNGLRSSIAQRRSEIEILELVGATYSMIRRPYVTDGAMMGFLSGVLAIAFSAIVYNLGVDAMASQIQFLSLKSSLSFLSVPWMLAIVACSTGFGLVGSYLAVRQLNGGYAAMKKVKQL